MLKGLGRFLAVILALAFFILLPFALLVVNAQTLLLSPDFYKHQLVKADFYAKVYDELLPALVESAETPEEFPLTKSEILQLLPRIVPEPFVRQQVEKAIDEMLAVLLSEKENPQIVVPLAEIKQRIPGEVADVLEKKLSELPPCPESASDGQGQLPGQLPSFLGPDGQLKAFPTCLPSGPEAEVIRAELRARLPTELAKLADKLPDNLDITSQLTENDGGLEELQSGLQLPRQFLREFARGAQIFYAALLVLLLLIGLLGGSSFSSGVGWIGVTLLLSGLAVLASTLVVSPLGAEFIEAVAHNSDVPGELQFLIGPLLESAFSELVQRTQFEAGGVTVVGGFLFFVSRVI